MLRVQVSAPAEPEEELPGGVFRYEFDGDRARILLGRRGGVDVLLPHDSVGLVHACIERRANEYFLVDEGEQGGTLLNGVAIPAGKRVALCDGDHVDIAGFALSVHIGGDADWPAESSGVMAREMARGILDRLQSNASHPSLQIADGAHAGVVLALPELGRTYVLGRTSGGQLGLDDVDLWRERVALVRDAEGVTARDLGVTPAPEINGERLAGARTLHDGDMLQLGATRLHFRDPAETYLRALEQSTPSSRGDAPASAAPSSNAPAPRAAEALAAPAASARRRSGTTGSATAVAGRARRGAPLLLGFAALCVLGALAGLAYVWLGP